MNVITENSEKYQKLVNFYLIVVFNDQTNHGQLTYIELPENSGRRWSGLDEAVEVDVAAFVDARGRDRFPQG